MLPRLSRFRVSSTTRGLEIGGALGNFYGGRKKELLLGLLPRVPACYVLPLFFHAIRLGAGAGGTGRVAPRPSTASATLTGDKWGRERCCLRRRTREFLPSECDARSALKSPSPFAVEVVRPPLLLPVVRRQRVSEPHYCGLDSPVNSAKQNYGLKTKSK